MAKITTQRKLTACPEGRHMPPEGHAGVILMDVDGDPADLGAWVAPVAMGLDLP